MNDHPDKTCFADRVVFHDNSSGADKCSVAFVTKTYEDDPHKGDLVFYCTVTHALHEAIGVPFGTPDECGKYFTNPEA